MPISYLHTAKTKTKTKAKAENDTNLNLKEYLRKNAQ
jgi:hypothetical protein